MISVRNYQQGDYKAIKEILQEAGMFEETWDSEENFTKDNAFTALNEGVVVGTIRLAPLGKKLVFLFRLAVKKEFQKQGIGTHLLEYIESYLKERGVEEVGGFVSATNEELQKFYKKRGLTTSGKKWIYMWKEFK